MFGVRKIFEDIGSREEDKELKELLDIVDEYEAKQTNGKDPISMHQKPTCRIEEGPKIRGKDGNMESYQMCKTCCREVHFGHVSTVNPSEDDDSGALMF